MLSPKRARRNGDDKGEEGSSTNEVAMAEGVPADNRQLAEISEKLSLAISVLHEIKDIVKRNGIASPPETTGAVFSELSGAMKSIQETITQQAVQSVDSQPANILEAEAMKIKISLGQLWNRKLNQRKNAYWAFIRNKGNLYFHEKWTKGDGSPIIIPRKFQKFEVSNEHEGQKQLREQAIAQQFKLEMEMERLKVEACIETARRIDDEMVDVIKSRCCGKVQDMCKNYWLQDVARNEDISKKRWQKNEAWLKSYEEQFLIDYKDKSPFFKTKTAPTFTNNSNRVQRQRPNLNSNKQPRPFIQNNNFNRNRDGSHRHNNQQRPQQHNQHASYAAVVKSTPANSVEGLLQQVLERLQHKPQHRQQHPQQRRGRPWNRSNNSVTEDNQDTNGLDIVSDPADYFRQADHNWHSHDF